LVVRLTARRRTVYRSHMRGDWVPFSASALVVGAMSLVFGALLNPSSNGQSAVETLNVVEQDGGRWLAMAVMFFFASLALTLGLPSVLTLFERRGRGLAVTGLSIFLVGAIGTCGYAVLMVFFRAMVVADAIKVDAVTMVSKDPTLLWFTYLWIGSFYGGLLVVAIALFVARTAPRWIPVTMVVFVAVLPLSSHLGRVGSALQVMCLAVACTGIAMAAVAGSQQRALVAPAF
jgi:hypothetical protein